MPRGMLWHSLYRDSVSCAYMLCDLKEIHIIKSFLRGTETYIFFYNIEQLWLLMFNSYYFFFSALISNFTYVDYIL